MKEVWPAGDLARRKLFRVLTYQLAAVATIGAAAEALAAEPPEIHIDNFKFTPSPLKVRKGSTVKWINRDDMPHSIVCQKLGFRSKALDTDDSTTLRFDQPGTYNYVCGLHPFMHGVVIVQG